MSRYTVPIPDDIPAFHWRLRSQSPASYPCQLTLRRKGDLRLQKDERKSRSLGSVCWSAALGDAESRRLCGDEHTLKYLSAFQDLSA